MQVGTIAKTKCTCIPSLESTKAREHERNEPLYCDDHFQGAHKDFMAGPGIVPPGRDNKDGAGGRWGVGGGGGWRRKAGGPDSQMWGKLLRDLFM